ncbi:MAG: tRNA (N(6)-L-threonylcarbamoyladenosine(37)-C(2))-methylthiotransferase MtaB [Candidatus Omnitrophica bacterium]|nr:tRNA (N(6)-L-threonylcarbamoyladenosine(37)-C(2))-methylthiotransferase MtaB [Candidatus Omnitrophota bacterium]
MITLNKKLTTVSFYTLGCRLNQSETAVIETAFDRDGYRVVSFDEPADIAVINTCTVTENGDADARRLVNKACRINPRVRIALIGCQAQIQKDQLLSLPNVQWVVGNQRKMDLAAIVSEFESQTEPQVITPTISRDPFVSPVAGLREHRTRANIKIQDGCDFFCSFCEIPYARGRARSRVFPDILREARLLVEAGHRELVVTGINVGTYRYGAYGFMDVINALEDISGLERIRISSIEPTTIPRELFSRMNKTSKLCRHLHIPLQSGSDAVLAAMQRKYTLAEFAEFVGMVRDTVDEVCIGTDVIVGFPGESEAEFHATRDALLSLPVHYYHVFSYSQRQLARSRRAAAPVPDAVIRERSKILRSMGQRQREAYYRSLIGTFQRVLFEQTKGGWFSGLTDNYVRVHVATKHNIANQIGKIRIDRVDAGKVYGIIEEI